MSAVFSLLIKNLDGKYVLVKNFEIEKNNRKSYRRPTSFTNCILVGSNVNESIAIFFSVAKEI